MATPQEHPAAVDHLKIGYVAFLDLLGFTHLVSRERFEGTWDRVIAIVSQAVASSHSDSLEYAIASDSIILTTAAEFEDLRQLLEAVGQISYQSLTEQEVAIRGGVAYGKYVRKADPIGGLLAGDPAVVAAYTMEQLQEWVGVTLAPEAVEHVPEIQDLADINVFKRDDLTARRARLEKWNWLAVAAPRDRIPVKRAPGHMEKQKLFGYVVVPRIPGGVGPKSDDALHDFREYEDKLEQLKWLSPDVRAQQKYVEASTFVGELALSLQYVSVDAHTKMDRHFPWSLTS